MADFDKLFEELILHEGTALTDDPDDRGGLTKFGISKEANPDIDVANLTLDKAKEIYKERYWNKFKIGDMPEQYRRDVFMNVVNSGPAFIEDMQSALGVGVDGIVGKQTLGALKKQKGTDLSSALFDAQVSRYIRLAKEDPSQRKYLNGWMNRVVGAKPGEVFASSKTDLRDLTPEQIRSTVDEVYTKKQVMTPAPEQPASPFSDLAVGFLENLNEYIAANVQRPQSASQAPSRSDTQPELEEQTITSDESMAEPAFTEAEEKLIQSAVATPIEEEPVEEGAEEKEPKFTAAEEQLIARASGTRETQPPVRAERREEPTDGDKDPIFGIF